MIPKSKENDRLIGRYGGEPGPTVLCLGGVHGNEPAGVHALERIFDDLHHRGPRVRGEIVGLAGNLQALCAGRRYVRRDLNRQWTDRGMRLTGDAEAGELAELRAALDRIVARARGTVYLLDLHTTSGPSVPFAVINDTLPNRAFSRHFPVPTILGLEEHVHGTVADYVHRLGCVTLGFESGQHDDPSSIDLHEAAVRLALSVTGVLRENGSAWADRLATAARGMPKYFEIRERYPLVEQDGFRMLPGFQNFQTVSTGQPLARDRGGVVRARASARIFMPLYQELGEDGFFLVQPVRSLWLDVSTVLRRARFLDPVVRRLPGVRPHPELDEAVTVDPRVARWLANEVFHLLGYRRREPRNGRLVYARRRHDPV